jgi:hypothetical protein
MRNPSWIDLDRKGLKSWSENPALPKSQIIPASHSLSSVVRSPVLGQVFDSRVSFLPFAFCLLPFDFYFPHSVIVPGSRI